MEEGLTRKEGLRSKDSELPLTAALERTGLLSSGSTLPWQRQSPIVQPCSHSWQSNFSCESSTPPQTYLRARICRLCRWQQS